MDNKTHQTDEIEALTSIYGSDWKAESETGFDFSMRISPDIKLFMTLNDEYPLNSPPTYQLLAPTLTRSVKQRISDEFEKVYLENIGGPVLFQWIEKLREILNEVKETGDEQPGDAEAHEPIVGHENTVPEVNLNVIHGTSIFDRKSTFQGHVCKIMSIYEVEMVMNLLKQNKKILQATHNIMAYRIKTSNGSLLQDCNDDGENHAGGRLLHLLQILDVTDVIVVVSRWYGGIHLGPDRFRHINNAARLVLEQAGLIKCNK